MKTKDEPEVTLTQLATCDEMDSESFSLILSKKIKSQLLCLEKNLDIFIKVVKTNKPGFLSYKELKKFIKDNKKDIDEPTISALGAVFDLSYLLFGDESGYIKQENVSKLISLMIFFNETVVEAKVLEMFRTDEVITFSEHNKRKSKLYSAFIDIGRVFKKTIIENEHQLDLQKFLKRFESLGNKEIIENTLNVLFLKKAFLGGEKNVLTTKELSRAFNLLPDIIKVVYDFTNIPDTESSTYKAEDVLKILKENILTVKKNFFYVDSPDEVIFRMADLKQIVSIYFPEYYEYFKYEESMIKVKEIILGRKDRAFHSSEILVLLDDVLYNNLYKGVNFFDFYDQNKKVLNEFKPIKSSFSLKHKIDSGDKGRSEQYNLSEFNRVIKNYRFFLGKDTVAKFDFAHNRSASGIFEVAIFEYIVAKFFKFYGKESKRAVGGYTITLEILQQIMIDLSQIFEGEGWIMKGRAAQTAETITLMTSLFHNQSDGDSITSVNEFVEFVTTMLTSLNLSNKMYENIKPLCEFDKKGKYAPDCYKKSLKKILSSQLSEDQKFKDVLPQLDRYLNKISDVDLDTYLSQAMRFSRTCSLFEDGTEVPMAKGDGITTFAGLLAIEQSMLRYDKDLSGLLEPEELDKAFEVYKPAIEALIPSDYLRKYSKGFFQYMIKFKRVPEVPKIKGWRTFQKAFREGIHFIRFLASGSKNKKANADRSTFAAILEIIAENSPARKENPIPCDTLR